jgi:XTP/dITP diphosphohydrolase
MMQLLVATTNPGKIREIRQVLDGLPLELVTLADLPAIVEPEETGLTFAANARDKALAYWRAAGMPTVAEDSGLAIDALGGRPGVASARYPGGTYLEKFTGLYRDLAPHPRPWTARFVCALAFIETDPGPAFECQATVEGEIAPAPAGTGGFGYDPIFFYPRYGATLAEVDADRKLAVSHRGRAFRQFRTWLETNGQENQNLEARS